MGNFTMGFSGGSAGKESACNAGDPGLIPGLGRSPGDGKDTQLSTFHFFTFNFTVYPLL